MTEPTGQPVAVEGLTKRFGSVTALDNVSFAVQPGEFLALLGPSGSGKSTILMSIAGFEQPDAGTIAIGGRVINHLPPHRRNIGLVFQRYALFPHLTVAENLAYPLHRRGVPGGDIARRVEEALTLVRLEGLGVRGVDALSGGQQQRVALARAVIFRPTLLLMDEPLSALDRKLRQHMQIELKLLHRSLGTTIILVTHDQEEALSMADRVALLDHGRLRQIGTPAALYRSPADAFVADFIGRTNFLPLGHGMPPRIAGFLAPLGEALAPDGLPPAPGRVIGVRPEHVMLLPDGPGQPCRVLQSSFGGAQQTVLIEAAGHQLTAELPSASRLWQAGDPASLSFLPGTCRIFDQPPSQEPV